MANPIGKYVTLFKGTPDNQVNMTIANEVDWGSFTSSTWQDIEVTLDADHKPRVCHGRLNESQIERYKTIWTGLGLAKRPKEGFSLITEGSVYDVLMTTNDRAQATNRTMTAIPKGIKPDDWDENYAVKYYESSVQPNSGDVRQAVYYPAQATWSATTQYYTSDCASWWYVKSGDNMLRFGVGDIGFTSGGFPSVGVLNNTINLSQTTQSPMFWTWMHDDTETIIKNQLVGNDYNFPSYSGTSSGEPGTLFNNGQRCRYLFSTVYNNNWGDGYNTDEAKGKWRTDCRNKVKIRNTTCTQFGFVTKDGHRYFGIWVLVPTIADMIGFNKYANNATGIPTSHKPTPTPPQSPHAYDNDLRIYNFDDPIPDTQAPNYLRIEFYGVEIDKIGITIEEKQGTKPPDTNPDPSVSDNWPKLDPVKLHGRIMGTLASTSESGFHIYDMNAGDFNSLQGELWNWGDYTKRWAQSVADQINVDPLNWHTEALINIFKTGTAEIKESRIDPLNAIVFARFLPGYIHNSVKKYNDYGRIKIAGLERQQEAYGVHQEVYSASMDIDCSELLTTGSYLDLAPFSTAEIYLPYIGLINLDPQDIVGGKIEVIYNVCVLDGTCSAVVYCYSTFAPTYPTQYGPYEGAADFTFPLAQKDANAFQRQLGYMKAIGAGVSGVVGATLNSLTGLAGGAAQNPRLLANTAVENVGTMLKGSADMATGLADAYMMKQAFHGTQLGSGAAIVTPTDSIYLIVTTPLPRYLNFEEVKKFGNTSGEITTVNGAKSSEGPVFCKWKYIDTSGITATAAEIEAIKATMLGGVYL